MKSCSEQWNVNKDQRRELEQQIVEEAQNQPSMKAENWTTNTVKTWMFNYAAKLKRSKPNPDQV